MAQYHQIRAIPGVQVAAPIAMVGYSLLLGAFILPLPVADYARPGRQLYRISTTWVSDGGTSHIIQPPSYLYVTPNPARFVNSNADFVEVLPGGPRNIGCAGYLASPGDNPFGVAGQSMAAAGPRSTGYGPGSGSDQRSNPGYNVAWWIPVLVAAVDPVAEAKLDGLNHALISGRYLAENASDGSTPEGDATTFPVLASSSSGTDEYALTRLQDLPSPSAPPVMSDRWMAAESERARPRRGHLPDHGRSGLPGRY